jgi:hypothetical protein
MQPETASSFFARKVVQTMPVNERILAIVYSRILYISRSDLECMPLYSLLARQSTNFCRNIAKIVRPQIVRPGKAVL